VPILHIANTSFEQELSAPPSTDLLQHLSAHPMYLQLQFLPFLYGNPEDLVFTTVQPELGYFERLKKLGFTPPQFHNTLPPSAHIEAWGNSHSVGTWAKIHALSIDTPSWDVVKTVNSKAFSFTHSPKLPGAKLLTNWEELKAWSNQLHGPKILKTCFGVSGRGHFHLETLDAPSLKPFVQRQWDLGYPLIAEPWVHRKCDFSTQWTISKKGNIEYLGCTLCENTVKGRYRGTIVGNPKELLNNYATLLDTHIHEAKRLLKFMQALGFFGHVGFDAMIYNENLLHPIVEINARKTMGWVALMLYRAFKNHPIRISLQDRKQANNSLLPKHIFTHSNREITFQKHLCVETVDL